MLKKIIYPELSYKITGLCFRVQNEMSRFAKERQYADRLEQLLKINHIKYQREIKLPFQFQGEKVKRNVADFLIEDKILLDCKAKKFISKEDYFQMQRYLKAAELRLGLIVNFRNNHLKPQRVINYSLLL